jgi:hypothetical protein
MRCVEREPSSLITARCDKSLERYDFYESSLTPNGFNSKGRAALVNERNRYH